MKAKERTMMIKLTATDIKVTRSFHVGTTRWYSVNMITCDEAISDLYFVEGGAYDPIVATMPNGGEATLEHAYVKYIVMRALGEWEARIQCARVNVKRPQMFGLQMWPPDRATAFSESFRRIREHDKIVSWGSYAK